MICYILQQSPLWADLPDGKRHVRILFMGLTIYIIMHALCFEYKHKNFFCKMWHGYFMWIIMADIFVCGINYKLYYGRTMIKELSPYENDIYDEAKHTYHEKKKLPKNIPDSGKVEEIFSSPKIIFSSEKNSPIKNSPSKNSPVKNDPVKNNPIKNNPIKNNPIKNSPVKNSQNNYATQLQNSSPSKIEEID